MAVIRVEREIAGRTLSFETGRMAKQAHGAVTVQYGDTVVLVTVLTAPPQREVDFFPMMVDYRENQYSAGKIPGGFFKREGRPSTKEILTMRLIDRPVRPLFPYDFMDEVQIQCMVLSTDNQNDPDLLAVIGTSAALAICPAPFDGPVAASRIGHIDGQLVVNPTHEQLDQSDMELVIAGPANAPNMIEFSGMEVSEELVEQAIKLGYEAYLPVIEMIQELADKVGVKKAYQPTPIPQDLLDLIYAQCGDRIRQAKQIPGKQERGDAISAIKKEIKEELCPEGVEEPPYTQIQVGEAFYRTEGKIQRELILAGTRPDGRGYGDVRPLEIEVGVLPRTHGSSIFARGETQCLATATLGTPRDQQIVDGLQDEYKKPFMLHYNFPPFCVGEVRPIRGPGRREIGHGALAEKSLQAVMPSNDSFPYTVRVVADMMESNGSTSMATVCGGCMALMDAGVPITRPVAGISIGMVSEGERYQLLTDIIGEEDFHGDMDFKVAGSSEGITGIQLDMKSRGLPIERMGEVLEQARQARLSILAAMTKTLGKSREDISSFAPRIMTIQINPEKIGKVIGPGGKTINKIQDETGATIDINDDGTIYISSTDAGSARAAKDFIEGLTATVEVGRIYEGKVVSIRDFGAFIEILPGQDGLCHVSELDAAFVKNVTDVCQVGDVLKVKVIAIDDQGRVKLSRKVLMEGGDKPTGDQEKHEGHGGHGGEKKKFDHKRDRKH
jgi:polyribonucleotide nucleotidyltransferase